MIPKMLPSLTQNSNTIGTCRDPKPLKKLSAERAAVAGGSASAAASSCLKGVTIIFVESKGKAGALVVGAFP